MKHSFKKVLAVLLAVLLIFLSLASAFPALASAVKKSGDYTDGEIIVVLGKKAGKSYMKSGSAYGSGIKIKSTHTYTAKKGDSTKVAVLKSGTLSTKQMLKNAKNDPAVKYAFPNYKAHASDITNDSLSKYQWALDNTGQNGGKSGDDVKATALWDKAAASKTAQIVAVADTGIDFDNPELKDKIWTNPYGSKLVGKHGYDFSGENEDGVPRDGNGHGTHCSGIIAAAADNGEGISGINKANVQIMPVKWLTDDGDGDTESVLAAYDYIMRAMDLGANVVAINNSWGGEGSASEQAALDEIFDKFGKKGAVSVIAAGNDGKDISEPSTESDLSILGDDAAGIDVPACSDSKYALTVAATNEKDELADFSNYSAKYVDVAAPGADILSTVSSPCFNPSIYTDTQKASLVANEQDYEGTVASGDFGYPNIVKASEEKTFSSNASVSVTNGGFGINGGKKLSISFNDKIKKGKTKIYAFEIPFTIPDETKEYAVSFMTSGLKNWTGMVFDLPADQSLDDLDITTLLGATAQIEGSESSNYWSHESAFLNGIDENGDAFDDTYEQDTSRKLLFVVAATETGSVLNIDDLAISSQNAKEEDFGKYDFYCGTSMAAPYVAGAAALIKNADSQATAYDIVSILKSTGRYSNHLTGKTASEKVLSLDSVDSASPLIFSAGYNKDGNVELEGAFKGVTAVSINGASAKPSSQTASKIVIPDNGYSTNLNEIKVSNQNGSDSATVLLSKKTAYPAAGDRLEGAPNDVTGGFMVPANDVLYYISSAGSIGKVSYNSEDELYSYEDGAASVDFSKLFTSLDGSCSVQSAVYKGSKLYVAAVRAVKTSDGDTIIGYDSAFASVNPSTGATTKLCELPDEAVYGGSLAAYNRNVYIAGGVSDGEFSNAFYRYSASKKSFVKQSAALPQGRAFTKFLQYGGTLVGVYGAQKDGEMPAIITFDGSNWKQSSLSLTSDDYDIYSDQNGGSFNLYDGSLGFGNGGIFCEGSYVYGTGDSFTYSPSGDKAAAFKYSAKNSLDGSDVIASTLPGVYIGFGVSDEDDIDLTSLGALGLKKLTRDTEDDILKSLLSSISSSGSDGSLDSGSSVYMTNMTTSYAKINTSSLKHAKAKGIKKGYNYGENVKINLTPSKGYKINSISINGKVVSKNKNTAAFTALSASNKITASTQYLVPSQVKSLKAKAGSKKVSLSWKKASRTSGYQVQKYENKKWKTVKTIKKSGTVKYTVTGLKKGKSYKFRVRAYNKAGGKTYWGKWSSSVKAKAK